MSIRDLSPPWKKKTSYQLHFLIDCIIESWCKNKREQEWKMTQLVRCGLRELPSWQVMFLNNTMLFLTCKGVEPCVDACVCFEFFLAEFLSSEMYTVCDLKMKGSLIHHDTISFKRSVQTRSCLESTKHACLQLNNVYCLNFVIKYEYCSCIF